MAWASCHALGADDWVVVAQQSDEGAPEFSQRVRQRARRLRKDGAQLDSVDVYAGPETGQRSLAARRDVVESLGSQMAIGGRLTLWSGYDDRRGDAELAAILAHLGPILAERQIAMNHQACESEQRSGVRHAPPTPPDDLELDFMELG